MVNLLIGAFFGIMILGTIYIVSDDWNDEEYGL